ncbi:MAG: hypothetical protein ABIR68_18665, partial [Ilumatobacteraceae bacterium]
AAQLEAIRSGEGEPRDPEKVHHSDPASARTHVPRTVAHGRLDPDEHRDAGGSLGEERPHQVAGAHTTSE